MNTKLLKQKILDLAIRGKLTQQLKSDGTARELLEQISSKVSSSSSTLSSPRRRGSPSAQSEKTIIPLDKSEAPFEIPANWEWVRLGDVCELISGQDFPPEKYNAEKKGLPYITGASNFVNNHVILNRWTEYPSVIAQKGDILLVCKGSGYGNYVYADFEKAHIARQIMAIRISDKTLNAYVYNFLGSQYERLKFQGNGLVPGIARSVVLDLIVPLPPLAEQQRIVAKIEEAFAEIDAIEKNKELLKTHIKQARQKILDLAIHGKLVPQSKADEPASVLLERITRDNPHYEKIEDEPFEIPENWAWCRLRNLSESIQYGYNAPAKDFGRIKMVRISDIHENEVEWDSVPYCDIDDKEIQTYLLKKNDILFARTGGTVGKSFIVSNLPEDAVYAGYLIRTRYGKNANAQYMKYFMESNLYWEQLRDGCIATAQPNCNGKTLGKMQIPLPPLNEQSRIVAKIEELFSTLDQMERNLV